MHASSHPICVTAKQTLNMDMNMNTEATNNGSGIATEMAQAETAQPCSRQPKQAGWQTLGMVALLVLALFLIVRVAMAVVEVHAALDSLTESMKYLRADVRFTNF
jgi:hypothetical protein